MLSGIVTAMLLVLFLCGSFWAFSPKRRREFDAAARLPFADDETIDKPVDKPVDQTGLTQSPLFREDVKP